MAKKTAFEITDAVIEAVSLVKRGANKSPFKIIKADGGERFIEFVKADPDRQLAYGVVFEPNVIDTQGDFMAAEEIEKAAHLFLARGLVKAVDTEHDLEPNGSVIVESFIAKKGDEDFAEGWVLGVHITDSELWKAVKSGDISGFSMFGRGVKTQRTVEVDEGKVIAKTQDVKAFTEVLPRPYQLDTIVQPATATRVNQESEPNPQNPEDGELSRDVPADAVGLAAEGNRIAAEDLDFLFKNSAHAFRNRNSLLR